MAFSWQAKSASAAASDSSTASVALSSEGSAGKTAARPGPAPDRRLWLALIGVVLLHISHPVWWQATLPAIWFPPAGVALLLTAWLGRPGALFAGIDALLILVTAWAL